MLIANTIYFVLFNRYYVSCHITIRPIRVIMPGGILSLGILCGSPGSHPSQVNVFSVEQLR